jgi:hypothetical protein
MPARTTDDLALELDLWYSRARVKPNISSEKFRGQDSHRVR